MGNKLKFCILGMLILAISQTLSVSAAKINPDGGYDIVLAIDEAVEKENAASYIENLKKAFQTLSPAMFIATGRFWVKQVEVIVPSSWSVDIDGKSGNLHYKNADIRISSTADYPYVLNPNLCRLPGDYMELPHSFFDTANTGDFGEQRKVLLNQWARLRWGVWEEHGYPGDDRFPYFFKNENNVWEVTGCFDAPLVGEFKTLAGVACDPSAATLDVNCRFYPAYNNNATKSIMSFHFQNGIEKFCDSASVNKVAPNRQNLYCSYVSAMDTIINSLDSSMVDITMLPNPPVVPQPKILFYQAPTMPPFHIILDKGEFDANEAGVVSELYRKLATMIFELDSLKDSQLIGLSVYPKNVSDSNLVNEVTIGPLGEEDRKNKIVEQLITVTNDGIPERDFGVALQSAAAQFSKSSPVNGGVVLLVKTGGASNASGFSFERDTQLTLLANKVKLFAIEVSGVDDERQNLNNVAIATQGESFAVNTIVDVNGPEFTQFLFRVKDAFGSIPDVPSIENIRLPLRREVTGGQPEMIDIPSGADQIIFHFTHPEDFPVENIRAGFFSPGYNRTVTFAKDREYSNGVVNPANRYIYTGILNSGNGENFGQLTFDFASPQQLPGFLIVTVEGTNIVEDVVVNVKTTAVNNMVDLASPFNANQPFAVFAEITQGAIAVTNANVTCTTYFNGLRAKSYQLKDDGTGLGDVAENDGIYSAIIIPDADGEYTFEIEATKLTTNIRANRALSPRSYLSLLPIDQDFNRTGQEGVDMPSGVTARATTQGSPITVMGRENYKYIVQRISDLAVVPSENDTSRFEFRFTKPGVLGLGEETADSFRIYRGPVIDDLVNLDISAPTLPTNVEELKPESNSTEGNVLTVRYISVASENTTSYVGVIAFYNGTASQISNLPRLEEKVIGDGSGEDDAEDGKSWIKSTAGIVTVVAIVVVVFAAAGGGYFYMKKKRSASTSGGSA